MPLKGAAFAAAAAGAIAAPSSPAPSTPCCSAADGPRGFNTDVGGIVACPRTRRESSMPSARADRRRRRDGDVRARRARASWASARSRSSRAAPRRSTPLAELGAALGIDGRRRHLRRRRLATGRRSRSRRCPATPRCRMPRPTRSPRTAVCCSTSSTATGRPPSRSAWERAVGPPISGLGMLLHQALLQVRIFAGGRPRRAAATTRAPCSPRCALALVGD